MSADIRKIEYTADALGMNLRRGSMSVDRMYKVQGPLGMQLPLQMAYSHGFNTNGLLVNSWKVSGNLYITVLVDDRNKVTVVLLDKGRWVKKMNLATHVSSERSKAAIDTVDKYLKVMGDTVIGVWEKNNPLLDDYIRIGGTRGEVEHLDRGEGPDNT